MKDPLSLNMTFGLEHLLQTNNAWTAPECDQSHLYATTKEDLFLSLCLINVYKIWVDWNSIERVSYVHEVGLYKQTHSSVMRTHWQNLFIHLYKQTHG